MEEVRSGDGTPLRVVSRGSGEPVTVFAHGMGASVAETRPLGSGVAGTRVFFAFRGHDGSGAPAPGAGDGSWGYQAFAGDLRAVADAVGARRALGVSIGAAALLSVLAQEPQRFERVVFFLPAVIDRPRADVAMGRLAAMADAVERGDAGTLAGLMLDDLPDPVRAHPEFVRHTRARARLLAGTAVSGALRALPPAAPLRDRAVLRAVTVPALVVGQEGDAVHPPEVARELAEALPDARLHVFTREAPAWSSRPQLRQLVAGFLNG